MSACGAVDIKKAWEKPEAIFAFKKKSLVLVDDFQAHFRYPIRLEEA
jgi:hypothetical protein